MSQTSYTMLCFFRQLIAGFHSIFAATQILILEICWCHFHKQAVRLQIKTHFPHTW